MLTRQRSKQLQCGICLDQLTFRGKIDHCDHLFCFNCISRWAKTENTCPLCKRRFHLITSEPTRPLYSDKARKLVVRENVESRDQAASNLLQELYDIELESGQVSSASGNLNFLYYLLALEEELNNF